MRNSSQQAARGTALIVAVCLALAAVVAACGGSSSSEGSGNSGGGSTKKVNMAAELKKPANITVWAWTPGTDQAVKMFEKKYPNIHVKLQNVGQGASGGYYRKLRTTLQSGKGLPDVVQMEFQYIPSFTITKSLADLTPYLPSNFLSNYPEWLQKQINLDGAIYGVPWDSGPLALIYRKDLLAKAGVKTPIVTWDDFAKAATKYHQANPQSYLINLPGAQTGQWLGLFWQNGAHPFSSDPNNFKINLTDPKVKQVTDYWDKLYQAGAISHDPDFTNAWYQGFAKGKYAGWLSAAWGPIFLQTYTKSSKGQWRAQPLPVWNAGDKTSGNWGGSTLAVLKASKQPAAATEFARWVLSEPQPAQMFSFERFLFPTLNSMLKNPQWLNKRYAFYGGQEVNKVYAQMANVVDKNWQWPPIFEYINTQGDDIKSKSIDQGKGATAALQPWQDSVINYAKQQGLTVSGQ